MTRAPHEHQAQPVRDALQARLQTLLPDNYQSPAESVQPVSMGSATLKFHPDGTVAWNEIWGSFCHLAMAGGPPHRGTLLEPATPAAIGQHPGRYQQVVDEICRGIALVSALDAEPFALAGWVRVDCASPAMAGWLARAIIMENVSVRLEGTTIHLPAGPDFRLEKEIKNVIAVLAKTSHYWSDHMQPARRQAIAELLNTMQRASPLLQPALAPDSSLAQALSQTIAQATSLRTTPHPYAGWLGLECHTASAAITTMRLLTASNLLARREGTAAFLPINPITDPEGRIALHAITTAHSIAAPPAL